MGNITIRMNKEEERFFREYLGVYGGGMSTMLKELARQKIEEIYDMKTVIAFEKGLKDGTVTTRPFKELLEEEGIDYDAL